MKQTLTAKNITWHDVAEPSAEELAAFVREVNVNLLDAEFIAQPHHRPEITIRPHYLLWLIQVPVFDRQARVTTGAPLYVLATETTVWTIHYEPIITLEKLIREFTDTPAKQEEYFDDRALGLALHVIDVLYSGAFEKLERLNKHLQIAADAVFHGNERKMVEEVAVLTRDVMDFRKVVRAQQDLFAQPPSHPFLLEEHRTHWVRIHGRIRRLWDLLDGFTDSVKELGRTNDSLLQHKENELLRILTFYSVITIPAFLLGQSVIPILGPDARLLNQLLFLFIFGSLTITLILILLHFKRKRVL